MPEYEDRWAFSRKLIDISECPHFMLGIAIDGKYSGPTIEEFEDYHRRVGTLADWYCIYKLLGKIFEMQESAFPEEFKTLNDRVSFYRNIKNADGTYRLELSDN